MFFCFMRKPVCCSLRTGTIITALVDIFICLLSIVVLFIVWPFQAESKWDPLIFGLPLTIILSYTFISILVLLGVIGKSPNLLLPWIVLNFVIHLALVVGIFTCATFTFIWTPQQNTDCYLAFIILGILLIFVYKCYTWAIVRSYYQDSREDIYLLQE